MTYMIDKIARAMHASVNGHVTPPPTWDNQSEQSQNYWRIGARAAIVAMREPNEAMFRKLRLYENHPDKEFVMDGGMWREMIDAALGDE